MNFRTEISIKPSPLPITHQTPVVCVGSCFAERIGERLEKNKFPVLVNPLGVIFNPVCLFDVLRWAIEGKTLPEELYTEREGLWFHYLVHSKFWANTQTQLASQIQTQMQLASQKLAEAKFLFITLGTAWVYCLMPNATAVANCHKQPAHFFEKRLLKVEEIVASFQLFEASLKVINPAIQVVFTVSPVRHLKDTLELNAVGKAVLRLAAHELTQNSGAYFPAYELLLDDLRDYRFYASDLLHPSEAGEQYIWEKFSEMYFQTETTQLLKKIQKIQTSLAHRPLQAGKAYQHFLQTLKKEIETLPAHLNFEKEQAEIVKLLL